MWCSECQADVSPSPDAPSSCGRCGGRLRMAGDATIREARDIISRWSSGDLLDRITSLPPLPELSPVSAGLKPAEESVAADSDDSKRGAKDNAGSDEKPSKQHREEASFESETGEEQSAEILTEEESHSILADLDQLARRANMKSADDANPTSAYLKLAEIDRPAREEVKIDVSDLPLSDSQLSDSQRAVEKSTENAETPDVLSTDHVEVDSSADESEIKRDAASTPKEQTEPIAIAEQAATQQAVPQQARKDSGAAAPSLSSLLKQSNSASVGQLAFLMDASRSQEDQDRESNKQVIEASIDPSEKSAKSLQSEAPSQLRSGGKQTKNEIEVEGKGDFDDRPVNLTTSDQAVQKQAAADFSEIQSEESDADQPILPVRLGDDAQAASQPVSADRKRVAQSRKAQRRQQHPRKMKQAASVLDDDDQKGMNTVSRKYRVDNPNPDSVEPAVASDQQDSGVMNSNSNSTGRRFRIDGAESMDGMLNTGDSRVRTQGRSRQRYIDEPHGNAIRGPHFEVVGKKRSNMASMTGQFLAYLGVLGLTVGTAIVIYGHFGGMSEYTPTGWLVTTVAQMMLFLGVINLVSGGIEQNNDDVSVRINTLGEQLMRIEQVTEQALRGPKIAASRYADPNSAPEESRTRETVEVEK